MTYKEAMQIARQEDSDARYFRAVDAILAAQFERTVKSITREDNQVVDIVTADNVILHEGDPAYNYYDMEPGTIGEIDNYPQPNTMTGQNSSTPMEEWNNYWFKFVGPNGGSIHLDGSRICTPEFAAKKGWV